MIHSLTGLQNSGKTLYMTYKLFQEYASGKIVITNYDLNFPHRKINREYLMMLGEKQPVLNNICFGLDELWIWLDCRKSTENTIATYFFLQSSKTDTNIYLTAQHNGQNEKRIRENMHRISNCERVLKHNNKFIRVNSDNRDLGKNLNEKLYIKVIEHKRVNMGIYSDVVPSKIHYIKAKPMFNLFDTRQKVAGVTVEP